MTLSVEWCLGDYKWESRIAAVVVVVVVVVVVAVAVARRSVLARKLMF